ncbi:hypothetical protein NOM01_11170 [Sporolactobacillus sp. STSJ-5]|uniref:hypothetical protein n=1 Tax=Sporolactobacillus sp. STSJ-5 TaxID=2965076 RepID=UPI00210322B2|nr:hypothetical protein [Sporolactobacillus sp. STSJ-5]MCQ2010577.1 hypothetical protein [Sporolactobacillus sp. STSJ-5]
MADWSNDAALGYMLLAAAKVGLTEDQKKKMLGAMYFEFDFKTVKEAAEYYRNR